MFFLKDKYTLGYKYGQNTFYGTKHLGQDYICPTGTKVYAPFNGTVVKTIYGTEGGYTTWFKPDSQNVTYRFLHLSHQLVLGGSHVNEGDLIAVSGNTGTETTAPHVHFDVFPGSILPPLIYTNFINPATINWNTMVTHKNIILLSHVNDTSFIQQAVSAIQARIAALGTITLEVDYSPTDAVFHTVNTPGFPTPIYADPFDIAFVGHQAELTLFKQVDSVCLIYDPAFVIGPPPTNPVENPVIIEGFNCFSIPTNWYSNPDTGELFLDSAKLYYYHELLHAWYFIINIENPTIGIPDKVHTYGGPTGPGHPTLEDNLAYFDSLVLELKPYWPSLANTDPVIKGEPMLIIHKKSDVNTKFVLENDFKRGYADFAAFQKDTAGRQIIEVALDDVEFNKIPTSQAVIKS